MNNNDTVLQRHPVRGALWGLLMGLGTILLLMVLSIVRLDIPTIIIYTVVGGVVGLLWGMFAPPKKPKGPAPVRAAVTPAPTAPAAPTPQAASYPEAQPDDGEPGTASADENADEDTE